MNLVWTDRTILEKQEIDKLENKPGIYRLIYFSPTRNNYYVYYVGQANDLKKRMYEHLLGNELNECCVKYLRSYTCYFRLARIDKQSERDGAEVFMFEHFKPECVEKVPDVDPIDINLV